MKKLKVIIPVFLFMMLLYSCEYQPDLSKYPEICFQNQALPIFQSNCAMSHCHNGSGEAGDLSAYQGILDYGIKPGDAKGSKIYQAITATWINPMPPSKPLSEDQRTLIRLWIDQGAKNTSCDTDTTHQDTTTHHGLCFNQDILPILVSYCSKSGCHDAATHQGDVFLSSYNGVMSTAGVSPGNPNSSRLYTILIEPEPGNRMPPQSSPHLSSNEINLIRQWIAEGATNDNSCTACDTTNVTYSGTVSPVINTSCVGCHSGTNPSGGISLGSYNDVHSRIDLIWTAINPGAPKPMPPSGSLSACKIKQIRIWRNAGSPNNK